MARSLELDYDINDGCRHKGFLYSLCALCLSGKRFDAVEFAMEFIFPTKPPRTQRSHWMFPTKPLRPQRFFYILCALCVLVGKDLMPLNSHLIQILGFHGISSAPN